MKHHFDDGPLVYCGIGMRYATTKAGMPHVCPIRKCARDRCCTGPLVVSKPPEYPDRLPADGVPQPGETFMPVCMQVTTERELARINTELARLIRMRRENPDMLLMEPRKAIAARKWTKIGEIPG